MQLRTSFGVEYMRRVLTMVRESWLDLEEHELVLEVAAQGAYDHLGVRNITVGREEFSLYVLCLISGCLVLPRWIAVGLIPSMQIFVPSIFSKYISRSLHALRVRFDINFLVVLFGFKPRFPLPCSEAGRRAACAQDAACHHTVLAARLDDVQVGGDGVVHARTRAESIERIGSRCRPLYLLCDRARSCVCVW
ncbi:hypothetical protein BKA93DRAFT_536401 [Sparassis latifolia]